MFHFIYSFKNALLMYFCIVFSLHVPLIHFHKLIYSVSPFNISTSLRECKSQQMWPNSLGLTKVAYSGYNQDQ